MSIKQTGAENERELRLRALNRLSDSADSHDKRLDASAALGVL